MTKKFRKHARLVLGILVSPFVTAIGMCVLTHGYLHFGKQPPPTQFSYLASEYLEVLPFAYGFMILPGLPIYAALRVMEENSAASYVPAGLFTGAQLSPVVLIPFTLGNDSTVAEILGVLAIFCLTGTTTAFTFYGVAIRTSGRAERQEISSVRERHVS